MMVVWVWAMLRLIRIPDASGGGKPATLRRAYRTCPGHHQPHQPPRGKDQALVKSNHPVVALVCVRVRILG